MRRYRLFALGLLLVAGTSTTESIAGRQAIFRAPNSNAVSVVPVDQYGGAVLGVAARGTYAYVGVGPRLVIVDLSIPTKPAVVGRTEPFPGIVRAVAVDHDHAYVAAGAEGGVRIIDISDPTNPVEVAEIPTPGDAQDVAVTGEYAYVAAGEAGGVRVLDVSDPTDPWDVGGIDTPGYSRRVVVSGGLAYVADGGIWWQPGGRRSGAAFSAGLLRIVDVSEPTAPKEVAAFDPGGAVYAVAVEGDLAYVVAWNSFGIGAPPAGMAVVSVADPAAPRLRSFVELSSSWWRYIALDGDRVFLENASIDVSDPDAPRVSGPGLAGVSCATADGLLVAAGDAEGLLVSRNVGNGHTQRLSQLRRPAYTTTRPMPSDGSVLAADFDELWALDRGDSGYLRSIGTYQTAEADIVWSESREGQAYISLDTSDGGRLEVLDVTDPSMPGSTGMTETGAPQSLFAVSNDHLLMSALAGEPLLRVLDVGDSSRPRLVGGLHGGAGFGHPIAVNSELVYTSSDWDGLLILDATDIRRPNVLERRSDLRGNRSAIVTDTLFLLADDELQIVDIRQPEAPELEGSLELPEGQTDIALWRGRPVIVDASYGLTVYDARDPSDVQMVARHFTPDRASGVAVEGDLAYVADDRGGFTVFQLSEGASDVTPLRTSHPRRISREPGQFAFSGGLVRSGASCIGPIGTIGRPSTFEVRPLAPPNRGPRYTSPLLDSGPRSIPFAVPEHAPVADDPLDLPLEMVDQLGGTTWAAVAGESIVYIGMGPRVASLDVSDPLEPVVVGRSDVLGGIVTDLHLSDSVVYATAGEAGLWALETSDPVLLGTLGHLDVTGHASGLTVVGGTAYVAAEESGLRLIDVADPRSMKGIGSIEIEGGATDVDVEATHAFVANGESELHAVDVGTPRLPRWVGKLGTLGSALAVDVDGTLAYVADGSQGLTILDVSDPATGTVVGRLPQPDFRFFGPQGETRNVAVNDSTAYLAGDYLGVFDGSGVRVVDVSDPSLPRETAFFDTPGRALNIALAGTKAYVSSGDRGLQIVDVSEPGRPVEDGFVDTVGNAVHVAVISPTIYTSDAGFGLRVFDGSGPDEAVEGARHFGLGGGFAYLPLGNRGLLANGLGDMQLLDWPARGVVRGVAHVRAYATGHMARTDGLVLAAAGQWGLRVFGAGDGAPVTELARLDMETGALAVDAQGHMAYVASGPGGLRMVDLGNPYVPREVAVIAPGGSNALHDVVSVDVEGPRAYVADTENGVWTVDISDPVNPTTVGRLSTVGGPRYVQVDGPRLWIAEGASGVSVVALDDENAPRQFARFETPGEAVSLTARGDEVHVADGHGGIVHLRLAPGSTPGPEYAVFLPQAVNGP